MDLTGKQQRFCYEYLIDFNATAAYQRAGYRTKGHGASVEASRLLQKPKIQAYLSQLRSRVSRNAEVTLERTLQEIARVAYSNITDVLSFDGTGVIFRDSAELPEDVTAAIASISSQSITTEGETRVTMRAKMHNKVAALNFLADFFGIKDDFNKARATLRRYGLLLVEDVEAPAGWRVDAYDPAADERDSEAAIEAFSEAIAAIGVRV